MKVFPLFAALALCLCLPFPAAADNTVPIFTGSWTLYNFDDLPPFRDVQSFSFGKNVSDGLELSLSFIPTIASYSQSDCFGGTSICYNGTFHGGSISFSADEFYTQPSNVFSFTGKITGCSFSGDYAENIFLDNYQMFRFTSSAWTCSAESVSPCPPTFNWVTTGEVHTDGHSIIEEGRILVGTGATLTMTTTAVPEPPALVGLLVAMMAVVRRRLWLQRLR